MSAFVCARAVKDPCGYRKRVCDTAEKPRSSTETPIIIRPKHAPADRRCSSKTNAKGARKQCTTALSRSRILSLRVCGQRLSNNRGGNGSGIKDEGDIVNKSCVTNQTVSSTHPSPAKMGTASGLRNGYNDAGVYPDI